MSNNTPSAGTRRYVAPIDETPIAEVDAVNENEKASSVWGDAWRSMRTRPLFWVCAALIAIIAIVALFPQWFTSQLPTGGACQISESLGAPRPGHPLGFDRQGCDVWARIVYGARSSVVVGILATVLATLIGGTIGALAGFYGGILDTLVSRLGDIFFAIPTILGAIVVMQVMPWDRNPITLSLVLAVFGWPVIARIMRGSVLSARNSDYVTASLALGLTRGKILLRHVLPNAIAPVIVIATISLGTYIVAEASLSFLGIGLPPSIPSWGGDISVGRNTIRQAPELIFFPSIALALTVLSFLLLGDIVRDALDPKARARR